MISYKIEGVEETNRKMKALDLKIRKKVVRKATRVGTNILMKEARSRAPRETGALAKSQYTHVKWKSKEGRFIGQVRTRNKKYGERRPSKYKHLVALGTKTAKAQPFYDQAFESSSQPALKEFNREYKRGVDAETRAVSVT